MASQLKQVIYDLLSSRLEMQKVKKLIDNIEEGTHISKFLIDIFRTHNIAHSTTKLRTLLSPSITRSLIQFLDSNIKSPLEDYTSVTQRSGLNTCHAFVYIGLRNSITKVLSETWLQAATVVTTESNRARLLYTLENKLQEIWMTHCRPVVEAEQRVANCDLRDLECAMKFVAGLPKKLMLSDSSYMSQYRAIQHIFDRLRHNRWMRCSSLIWHPGSLGKCFDDKAGWLGPLLPRLLSEMERDKNDLEILISAPLESPLWSGVELSDSISDPQQGFEIMKPGLSPGFLSPSGRVYVRRTETPLAGTKGRSRGITAIQCFYVVQQMLSKQWLHVGTCSESYVLTVAREEYGRRLFAASRLSEYLTEYCCTLGVDEDGELVKDMFRNADKEIHSLGTVSTCAMVIEEHGEFMEAIPTKLRIASPAQYICNVCPTANTPELLASRVSPKFIIDYLVIFSILCRLRSVLEQTLQRNPCEIVLRNKDIVGTVDILIEVHRHRMLHTVSKERLSQLVPSSIRQLLSAGNDATAATNNETTSSVIWNATFLPIRFKSELILTIGTSSHDPACKAFCNLCDALLAHFSCNWPLPKMVPTWQPHRLRPPRKASIIETIPETQLSPTEQALSDRVFGIM